MNRRARSNLRKQSINQRSYLQDVDSYLGQQHALLTMPQASIILTTTVTTGVIASAISISGASVQNFPTRFGSTFDEFRLLKAVVRIRPLATASGLTRFWFDEKSSSVPAANEAEERYTKSLVNTQNNSQSCCSMTWQARDLLDLEFVAIGSSFTPLYFKTYTDVANLGGPQAATALWIIEPMITLEFRGIKGA